VKLHTKTNTACSYSHAEAKNADLKEESKAITQGWEGERGERSAGLDIGY
jgi:hypothetical protein